MNQLSRRISSNFSASNLSIPLILNLIKPIQPIAISLFHPFNQTNHNKLSYLHSNSRLFSSSRMSSTVAEIDTNHTNSTEISRGGPIEQTIHSKLTSEFSPISLSIINESNNHNVPRNSETHFKVIIISNKFIGISLINRHRMINTLLSMELKMTGGIHALSIIAKTEEEWNKNNQIESSPNCMGGEKKSSKSK